MREFRTVVSSAVEFEVLGVIREVALDLTVPGVDQDLDSVLGLLAELGCDERGRIVGGQPA